jgi:hypothetical protein
MKKSIRVLSACALSAAALFVSCSKSTRPESAKPTDTTSSINNANIKSSFPGTSPITFAGYTWNVTSTTGTQGPGPNHWSSNNAYVDANGYLHMKLTHNTANNTWDCSQITMTQSLGYGTYQWKVEGRLDTLDKNVVFGLFNYSGNDGFDEMDIEFSRWGYTTNNMLAYTIYPQTGSTATRVTWNTNFTQSGTYTTHRFTRTSSSIVLKSLAGFQDGDTNLFATKSWSSPTSISTLAMPVMINLWLFHAVPPTNGSNVEIIIHDFKFTPL